MSSKRFLLWFVFLLVCSIVGPALALTGSVTGTEVSLGFTESTTNEDGSILQDLHHSNVYYTKDSDGIRVLAIPEGQVTADIPATSLMGGGVVSLKVVVPVTAQEDVDVTFVATHTDDAGNESVDSSSVVFNIDKLPPGAPQ